LYAKITATMAIIKTKIDIAIIQNCVCIEKLFMRIA